MQRDKFLETEQVAWVTLQPRQGLLLKVTPLASQQTPSTATEGPVTPPETPSLPTKTPLTPSDAESANDAD